MIRRIPWANAYIVLSRNEREETHFVVVLVVVVVVVVVVDVVVISNLHATRFLFLRPAESKSERTQTTAYV